MVYTEIKERNGKKYFYRVKSIREGKKFKKKRIYLGKNFAKKELLVKEKEADKQLVDSKKESKALAEFIPKIKKILKKYKIKRAGIFGSYAEGKEKKNSDIDILIEPTKNMGLEFIGVQFKLEDELKKKVDLLTYNGIHPLIKEDVLKREIRII